MAALKADETHFRAYFEHFMVGMAAVLPDKSFLEVNSAFCKMLGYSSEELLSSTYETLAHPDVQEDNNRFYQQLLDGSLAEYVIEKRLYNKAGDLVDALIGVRAARTSDGSLAYAALLIKDISYRKQVERRKHMRQLILEKVARGDALQDIMLQVIESIELIYPGAMCSILLADKAGQYLVPAATSPKMPDYYSQISMGVKIAMGFASSGTAAFLGKRVLVENLASHRYWTDYKELTAKLGLGACWSEPIFSASGSVLGVLAIFRKEPSLPSEQKLTLIEVAAHLLGIAIERGRAAKELQLASSIYTNISESVLVLDVNHKIIALNPAFTRINGYTLEDVRGKNIAALYSERHDPEFFQAIWAQVAKRGFWQGQLWSLHKNGSAFQKWLTINTMYNEQGEVENYVTTGSDISDKIRADELIWHQANYDLLTGLPNRHMFQDRLEQQVRKALREKNYWRCCF